MEHHETLQSSCQACQQHQSAVYSFSAQVRWSNIIAYTFEIKTGVKQGCILSPFLFMLSMDWIMRNVESAGRRGIIWTLTTQLEDLDFADDICLTSRRLLNMQSKTEELSNYHTKVWTQSQNIKHQTHEDE